jgi:hypothetical protein
MILLAHIAGVPVEEFLTPMASGTVYAMLLTLATIASRLRPRSR